MEVNDSEDLLKSNLAMRVAVQTMKERCQSLQQRVSGLEEENYELHNRTKDHKLDCLSSFTGNVEEIESLRKQILDLHQQKAQLNEHVAMVAAENRQLWSRLSQLSKKNCKQSSVESENDKICGQNLVRSKTFTQHSPNPYIRPKHIEQNDQFSKTESISLEEVVLFQSTGDHAEEVESLKGDTLQFSYLNDVRIGTDIDARELTSAANKCADELSNLKQQLIAQQNELKNTICDIKQKLASHVCKECELRSIKPETADKSLETDESLYTDVSPSQSHQSQEDNAAYHPEILNDRNTEENIKICPMCARKFSQDISFDYFREHVTEHFIDEDEDGEGIYDPNFEIISHKVGEF